MAKRRPIVMVSSSVYGQEELLELIYSLLTTLGYEVWMSYKGTIPTNSDESSLESCLKAVENCDMFLGLITTNYGTTKDGEISATHSEFKRAIELNKRRWFLIHDRVVFARQILRKLGHNNQATRHKLDLKILAPYISDLRVFDMYEDALDKHEEEGRITVRWVQEYDRDSDALLFATSQFSRYQDTEQWIKDQFPNKVKSPRGKK